ncbi:hypothetical protein BU16DRAFT_560596 [Lophium mytilinum]|uniref:Uncharacterized protein n=1 Tax=Lophium mytilinum TaxID=390894 RepID=A0A6A6QZZ1_9PEZI|nr:hypothetical protein BU16DRAFT_560596 [Lophium mytilinum]
MSLPWWWLVWQYYENDTIILRTPTGELHWKDGEWQHGDYPPQDLGRHYFPYERTRSAPPADNVQIGGFGSWPEDSRPTQPYLRSIMQTKLPRLPAQCQQLSSARWPRTANLADPKASLQKEQVDRFRGGMLPPEACDVEAQASLGDRFGKGLTFSVAVSMNDTKNIYDQIQENFADVFGHWTWIFPGYSHLRPTMPTASDFGALGQLRRSIVETLSTSSSSWSPSAESVLSGLPGRFIDSLEHGIEIRPSRPQSVVPSPHRDEDHSFYEKIPQIPNMSPRSTRKLFKGFRRLRSDDLEPITFEKRTLDTNTKLNQSSVITDGLQKLASSPTNSTVDFRSLHRVRGFINLRDGRYPSISGTITSGDSVPFIRSRFSSARDSVAVNYDSSFPSSFRSISYSSSSHGASSRFSNHTNEPRTHEPSNENGLGYFVDRWQARSPLASLTLLNEEPNLEIGANVDLEAQAMPPMRGKKPLHKKVIRAMKKTAKTLFRKE